MSRFALDCVSFGVPLRVLAESDELLAELPRLLPHATEIGTMADAEAQSFSLEPPSGGHGYLCRVGGEVTLECDEAGPVLEQFARQLMVHVANLAPEYVFVHAGVVGYRGRALVLPGTSFAGKTTLTGALVRAGATYYSDEYAVVDSEGWVHPYARDLQVREQGRTEQRSMPIAALSGLAGTVRLRVTQLVFARYRKGAVWTPQPISAGMAVLELLRHTIPVQRTPARVMATLTMMLEGATAWRSERGEAEAMAGMLLESLARNTSWVSREWGA